MQRSCAPPRRLAGPERGEAPESSQRPAKRTRGQSLGRLGRTPQIKSAARGGTEIHCEHRRQGRSPKLERVAELPPTNTHAPPDDLGTAARRKLEGCICSEQTRRRRRHGRPPRDAEKPPTKQTQKQKPTSPSPTPAKATASRGQSRGTRKPPPPETSTSRQRTRAQKGANPGPIYTPGDDRASLHLTVPAGNRRRRGTAASPGEETRERELWKTRPSQL